MCGIFASIRNKCKEKCKENCCTKFLRITEQCHHSIKRRGPDAFSTIQFFHDRTELSLSASVLSLRGKYIVSQPFIKDSECLGNNEDGFLLWNGEVFGGSVLSLNENDQTDTCDTVLVWEACKRMRGNVHHVFLSDMIEGPYAFVYYEKVDDKLWFGRDCFGRRSLLWSISEFSFEAEMPNTTEMIVGLPLIITSSYMDGGENNTCLYDVPVNAIYCVENVSSVPIIRAYPRNSPFYIPLSINTHTNYVDLLYNALYNSVKRRVTMIDRDGVGVGILFSGGLDSAVIAAIADIILPIERSVDLINVAFENPRFIKNKKDDTGCSPFDFVPDRQTAIECIKKDLLGSNNSKRNWRFIEVNVSVDDAECWKSHIRSLMGKSMTVMDWSIAAPFWFASKETPKETKVLLCGFGADELLCGYRRYKTKYARDGWNGMEQEMKFDLERMWKRNLGRDDRMFSDHGREMRYPFLDEQLVRIVIGNIPTKELVKLSTGDCSSIEEKYLLRRVAKERLGLNYSSTLPKRAIQFGCKSSKMYNGNERGTDAFE